MPHTQLALFQERVTWPHSWRSKHTRQTTTRTGRFIGKQGEDIAVVYYRAKDYRVALNDVRRAGEVTALTEAVLMRR